MKFSEIKQLKDNLSDLLSDPNWREVLELADYGKYDFEVDGVRFIASHSIDEIQQDELLSEPYLLGCFVAGFIANILDIDVEEVQKMQAAEAFEGLGKLMVPHIEEVQKQYASADGYGHHFNGYDFSEEEMTIAGINYHVFDNRG